MTFRVLVTGSRTWQNIQRLYHILDQGILGKDSADLITFVHGDCPSGVDRYVREYVEDNIEYWLEKGINISQEPHPANWANGKGAGFARNQEMVDLGADLCLAFIHNGSNGATHCANAAEKAGIRTIRYKE